MTGENKAENIQEKRWYLILPLIFIIAVVPLIVHLELIQLSEEAIKYWIGQSFETNVFSFDKMIFIILFSFFALIALLFKAYKDKGLYSKDRIYYRLIFIYTIFVAFSTIFSKNLTIAAVGFPDRYEGALVLVSYMVILLTAMHLVKGEKLVKIMLYALFISATIIGILELLKILGYDVLRSQLAANIIAFDSPLNKYIYKILFGGDSGDLTLPIGNKDYLGSYFALLLPLIITILIFIKDIKVKAFMGILTLLLTIDWIGCNSRAGIVGGVAAIILLAVIARKQIKTNWKTLTFVIASALVIFVVLGFRSNGYLFTRVKGIFSDVKSIVKIGDNNYEDLIIKDVKIDGGTASIIDVADVLNMYLGDNLNLSFRDSNNKLLSTQKDKDGKIHIKDDRYKDYSITYQKMNNKKDVFVVQKSKASLFFEADKNKFVFVDVLGRPVDNKPVEKWGFEGNERIGTSRGYIWSRSIPLLKHTILLGYGPDTFAIHFPQNDWKGKLYAYPENMWIVVDKPHNLYLQIGINTGVISLLALLLLFGLYIFSSAKIYFKRNYDNLMEICGAGIFLGICGYLVAGLFNDSINSVAPVFWALLGIGIAINETLKQESFRDESKEQEEQEKLSESTPLAEADTLV